MYLEEIKKKALNDNIPIIMDETLEYIDGIIKTNTLSAILEVGTAVRIFCNVFFKILNKRWSN